MAMIAASLPTLGPLFKTFLYPSRSEATSQTTASIYPARRPERLRLSSLSNAQRDSSMEPSCPSILHTKRNDFDKNPGNRPLACNYTVEVSATKFSKKARTGSCGAYCHSKGNDRSDDGELGNVVTAPEPVFLASNLSSECSEACPTPAMTGIIRTTDVYVHMEDALDEESEGLENDDSGRRRSRWKC